MEPALQTFIIIKYGDNQQAIANPFCSSHALLEWMRRKCRCDDDSTLDLVDLDGQVKNLPSSTQEYASDYVIGRETYILIRVDKQADNGSNRYVSLLNNLDDLHPDLMVKLNSLSRPATRAKSSRLRGRHGRSTRALSTKPDSAGRRPISGERRHRQSKQ